MRPACRSSAESLARFRSNRVSLDLECMKWWTAYISYRHPPPSVLAKCPQLSRESLFRRYLTPSARYQPNIHLRLVYFGRSNMERGTAHLEHTKSTFGRETSGISTLTQVRISGFAKTARNRCGISPSTPASPRYGSSITRRTLP